MSMSTSGTESFILHYTPLGSRFSPTASLAGSKYQPTTSPHLATCRSSSNHNRRPLSAYGRTGGRRYQRQIFPVHNPSVPSKKIKIKEFSRLPQDISVSSKAVRNRRASQPSISRNTPRTRGLPGSRAYYHWSEIPAVRTEKKITYGLNTFSFTIPAAPGSKLEVSIEAACSNPATALTSEGLGMRGVPELAHLLATYRPIARLSKRMKPSS